MKITLFGIIWLLITLIGFFIKNKNYMLFLLIFSAILQCNSVFLLGNNGVNPLLVNSLIFIIYYFLNMPKKRTITIEFNKIKSWLLILFLIITFSVIHSKIININISSILQLVQLLIYIITFFLVNNFCKLQKVNVKKIIIPIIWFVVVFGFFQMLMTIGILPKYEFIINLFYNEINNPSIAFLVDTRIRFYSTFMEASYCSAFLLASLTLLLFDEDKRKSDILLIVLLTICSILTYSTTGYVGICICYFIYIIKSKNYKLLIYFIPVVIILLIILYYNGILDKVIFNKHTSGSAYTRKIWNRNALQNFKSSPLIGIGYKSSRASSLIFTILAETGILGLISYTMLIINLIKFPKKEKLNMKTLYALIIVVICQCISLPDLNFCVFWLIMYIYAMSYYKNRKEIQNEL